MQRFFIEQSRDSQDSIIEGRSLYMIFIDRKYEQLYVKYYKIPNEKKCPLQPLFRFRIAKLCNLLTWFRISNFRNFLQFSFRIQKLRHLNFYCRTQLNRSYTKCVLSMNVNILYQGMPIFRIYKYNIPLKSIIIIQEYQKFSESNHSPSSSSISWTS